MSCSGLLTAGGPQGDSRLRGIEAFHGRGWDEGTLKHRIRVSAWGTVGLMG